MDVQKYGWTDKQTTPPHSTGHPPSGLLLKKDNGTVAHAIWRPFFKEPTDLGILMEAVLSATPAENL